MSHTLDFLARLGLDPSADERAIRRAYARQLKQIDQETQGDLFQLLRDDYETAMAWLSWRAEDAEDSRSGDAHTGHDHAAGSSPDPQAPSPGPAPPHGPDAPERDPILCADTEQLADEVFLQFLDAMAPLRAARPPFHDAIAELRRCIADDRLFNIAAGMGFEARIAACLVGPQQPDHEALLTAAMDVFGWTADRHRLDRFGYAGATLNRAIDEHIMFMGQTNFARGLQRQALDALRKPGLPNAREMRRLMPHVNTLTLRFPVLMTLIADQHALERWREANTPAGGNDGESSGAAGDKAATWGKLFGAIGCVMLLLLIAFNTLNAFNSSKLHARFSAIQPTDEQAESAGPAPPPDPYDSQPLKRAQLDEIGSHILYRIADEDRPGTRSVEYAVHLDGAGSIKSLDTLDASGNDGYDDAIRRAIWASSPYEASTARDFSVRFTMRIVPGIRPYEFAFPPVPRFDPEHAATGSVKPPELTHSKLLPAPTVMRLGATPATP